MKQESSPDKTDSFYFIRLTPAQEGGIGVFQIYGAHAENIVSDMFSHISGTSPDLSPGRLYFGHLKDGEEMIDEVVVRNIPEENSFMSLPVYELNVHSGPAVLNRISKLLLDRGGKKESEEVYLNRYQTEEGHSGLQMDAYREMLSARTRREASAFLHQFHHGISSFQKELARFLSTKVSSPEKELVTFRDRTESLLNRQATGLALTRHRQICLVGPPNVGKSTLLNNLAQQEKSIVHEQPGTTRDVVHSEVYMKGYTFRIEDTAGIRKDAEEIEEEGIKRGVARMKQSDLILWMSEASTKSLPPEGKDIPEPDLYLANKADLLEEPRFGDTDENGWLHISALTEDGMETLEETILKQLGLENPLPVNCGLPFYPRHVSLLEKLQRSLKREDIKKTEDLVKKLGTAQKTEENT